MLLTCPSCRTYYRVEKAFTAEQPVRCAQCQQIWIASPQDAQTVLDLKTNTCYPKQADGATTSKTHKPPLHAITKITTKRSARLAMLLWMCGGTLIFAMLSFNSPFQEKITQLAKDLARSLLPYGKKDHVNNMPSFTERTTPVKPQEQTAAFALHRAAIKESSRVPYNKKQDVTIQNISVEATHKPTVFQISGSLCNNTKDVQRLKQLRIHLLHHATAQPTSSMQSVSSKKANNLTIGETLFYSLKEKTIPPEESISFSFQLHAASHTLAGVTVDWRPAEAPAPSSSKQAGIVLP